MGCAPVSRLYNVMYLFHKDCIEENFRAMHEVGFPYRVAHRGEAIAPFIDRRRPLPEAFSFEGKLLNTAAYLRDYWATGLVVLRCFPEDPTKAELLHEEYFRGNTGSSRSISWSMGKSVLSFLFGVAIEEGLIGSLDDVASDYAPELIGSGYEGVKLKDIIQMSSGVGFNEDYGDFFSDINKFGRVLALGGSINQLAINLKRERPPGTFNHYNSMDTQVVGIVLHSALKRQSAGRTLTQYLEEKLWRRAGFEDDVWWLLDNKRDQMEAAVGTLNARTRDFARFGWLYFNEGRSPLDGSQLVSSDWVHRSVTPDAPHLMPGSNDISDYEYGYGYQWWVLGKDDAPTEVAGDYMAIGIYNQFIYVSPADNIVIARNSAYPDFDKDELGSEKKAIAFFRAVAKAGAVALSDVTLVSAPGDATESDSMLIGHESA